MHKEKGTWEKNLADVEAMPTKISVKENYLRESPEDALCSKIDHEEDMLDPTDKQVSTFGVYFKREKEHVSFFNP